MHCVTCHKKGKNSNFKTAKEVNQKFSGEKDQRGKKHLILNVGKALMEKTIPNSVGENRN